jgi:hypothetical protein
VGLRAEAFRLPRNLSTRSRTWKHGWQVQAMDKRKDAALPLHLWAAKLPSPWNLCLICHQPVTVCADWILNR